jgi:hypothetical protein
MVREKKNPKLITYPSPLRLWIKKSKLNLQKEERRIY